MNKRIILSGGMLVFMAAIVAGGTGAFFSDTETSANNVFTAGSVSIELLDVQHDYGGDDTNAPVFDWLGGQGRFTLDDLKPLDTGMLDLDLVNGANEAHVCAMITGDPSDLTEANDIALYDQLNFFQDDGTQVVPGTWFDLGIANPNGTVGTGVDYCFGEANVDGTGLVSCDYGDGSIAYNDAQNGSFAADLMFYAIQTRNNESFSCDQLENVAGVPTYTPAPQVLVGANFDLYEAPGNCSVTLASGASVNDAIANAASGAVICLGDGTYTGSVELNKDVTLASVSGPAATTIDGGIKITSSDATVKGFTVLAGIVSAEPNPVGFYVASGNNIEISSNEVDGTGTSNGSGILTVTGATYSNVLVENNIFTNLTRGVYANPATGVIDVHYNDFLATNAVGIAGFSGADAWRNEFSAAEALGVDGSYDSNPSTVEENNFLNGANINVYAVLTTNVNAPNNFFNLGAVAQTDNQIAGQVDSAPIAPAQFGHR